MKFGFRRVTAALLALLLVLCFAFTGCELENNFDEDFENLIEDSTEKTTKPTTESEEATDDGTDSGDVEEGEEDPICKLLGIPAFSNKPFVALNGNKPTFTDAEITTKAYEFFSELDNLGRCGYVMSCVGQELMPTEDRGEIGHIRPTGWVQNKYDSSLVSGGNLYNRCHLIGFQLTGENDNNRNLITGTRYMNWDGMVEFENMIADYVKETGNHVMYRVTPMFYENELVARGVKMEAYSVEDRGEGICFNVYAYNVQPGITIDYKTGNNWLSGEEGTGSGSAGDIWSDDLDDVKYIVNASSKTVHIPTCSGVSSMSDKNKRGYDGELADLQAKGYSACGKCLPQN